MKVRTFAAAFLAAALPCVAGAQETSWQEPDGTWVHVTSITRTSGSPEVFRPPLAVAGGCTSSPTSLCLVGGRFLLEGTFTLQDGQGSGPLSFVKLTDASGYFYYNDASDVQAVVKVLDVCGFAQRFWVFIGALTDQGVTLKITDTFTGAMKTYVNPLKNSFLPIYDFDAFATCGAAMCTYGLSPTSQSFGSSGGSGAASITTQAGCAWNAVSNDNWITIDPSTEQGTGSGTIGFDVDPNSGGARQGTFTAGGQTFTVSQSGVSAGGQYDGQWKGASTQDKNVEFTIVNNAFTMFSFEFHLTGSCTVDGMTTIAFTPPRAITGTSFTISSSGSLAFTVTGTFTSAAEVVGSINVSQSSPCSASGAATYSASKQ